MKTKELLVGVAKYAVGFGLLGFVVYQNWEPKLDKEGVAVTPGLKAVLEKTPDWGLVAACAALMVVVVGLQFYRWYLLVRAVDLPFTVRDAVRLGLVGLFYNTFLPGAIGGDAVKAFYIARDRPGRRPAAVSTVVLDRLLGLFGLMLLAATVGGGCWLAGNPQFVGNAYLEKIIVVTTAGVSAMVVGWIGLGLLPARRLDRFGRRLAGVPKLGRTLGEVWDSVRLFRARSKVVYLSVLLSAGSHLSMVLMFHCAVRVFGIPGAAGLAEHAVVTPMGYIAQVFVPVPGGVGGSEFIFGELYSALGKERGTGVFGRLTLRVFEWGAGLVGYLVFLRMKAELPVPAMKDESVS